MSAMDRRPSSQVPICSLSLPAFARSTDGLPSEGIGLACREVFADGYVFVREDETVITMLHYVCVAKLIALSAFAIYVPIFILSSMLGD